MDIMEFKEDEFIKPTLSSLKTGDIVELRNGERLFVLHESLLDLKEKEWGSSFDEYSEDLKYCYMGRDLEFDIVKIAKNPIFENYRDYFRLDEIKIKWDWEL